MFQTVVENLEQRIRQLEISALTGQLLQIQQRSSDPWYPPSVAQSVWDDQPMPNDTVEREAEAQDTADGSAL